MTGPRAVIFGCAGTLPTEAERRFFRDMDPLGFILFQRNCVDPEQVRRLTAALRETVGRDDAPVLIDQEGGRVQRLKPPHWRQAPAAAIFGQLARRDPGAGARAAWINARLIAAELAPLGITADCAPVLDVPVPGAHDIIGDRAFDTDPSMVSKLGRASAEGLMAGGVLPIVKHIPGHGRALVDSHVDLPVVDCEAAELARTDLAPFRALADLPLAMTAHVVFTAWDRTAPASLSGPAIEQAIRGLIGFEGALVSDDLGMNALAGSFAERTHAAFEAGSDLVLHCSGDGAEMAEVAAVAPRLAGQAALRVAAALGRRHAPEPVDPAALAAELAALLGALP